MAKQTILVSDLTGAPIDGRLAQVKIMLESKPNSTFLIDANESEVTDLIAAAHETKKRGRKPGKR